ncbi:MAG: hypothetical protein GXP33_02760 [Spirochaetes bacterium]|nr:hypothetical protein [Spirochaetota bacterium]
MKKLSVIRKKQKEYIKYIRDKTIKYVNSIPKLELEVILLSGSVARGDYYPGKYGAMIDLTIMSKKESTITLKELFGENEDTNIPYHCIKRDGEWFQIAFNKFLDNLNFQKLEESKKFALLESCILWENKNKYSNELEIINKFASLERHREKQKDSGYIAYLLSDYKKNRWELRNAYLQLHANLNTAIQYGLKCLYYINGKYAPAEDRRLYYSYELEKLPTNYEKLTKELYKQDINSLADYKRREKIFRNEFLSIL